MHVLQLRDDEVLAIPIEVHTVREIQMDLKLVRPGVVREKSKWLVTIAVGGVMQVLQSDVYGVVGEAILPLNAQRRD